MPPEKMQICTTHKTMTAAQYTYDALGRRIEAAFYDGGQLDTVRRYWYNDQWQALTQEMWMTGQPYSVRRNYLYGNYIDEVLGFEWAFAEIPWGWFYYLHDHLYSPVALLDEWNGILERYEYDAYGRREVMTAWFTPLPNGIGEHGLTGRELDELDFGTSGSPRLLHMHYRHRDYSPQLGRFMQHDPLGTMPEGRNYNRFDIIKQYIDGTNLYAGYFAMFMKVDSHGLDMNCPGIKDACLQDCSQAGLPQGCHKGCIKDYKACKEKYPCRRSDKPNYEKWGYSSARDCAVCIWGDANKEYTECLIGGGIVGCAVPSVGIGIAIGAALQYQVLYMECSGQDCLEYQPYEPWLIGGDL